jgi:hypothetical protein
MRCALWPLTVAILVGACKKSQPPPDPEAVVQPTASPKSSAPPRCSPLSKEPPFVLGPTDTGRVVPSGMDAGETVRDDTLPFAAEVGDGVAFPGGFAVGAIHESDTALAMSVVTLDANGHNPKIIPLGIAHGDVEPPRVFVREGILAAGVLEPGVSGRSLRLAKIENGAVTWGATIHEQGGESQAFDVALGDKKGIVVWDEDGATSSVIQVSTFDTSTLSNATPPRTISRPLADAESPRLIARPGGYWLAYIGRSAGPEDSNNRAPAEDIGQRWIEVVPLDANGSPTALARAATPKDGHVMVFDMAAAPDGGAVLAYRYDDTPTGAPGGQVMRVVVHPTSIEPPSVLIEDEVGAGVPNLLPGWIAVLDAADVTRLAPLGADGQITASLNAEPDVGSGEPVAANANRLLVARPAGRAVKLVVLECRPDALGDR